MNQEKEANDGNDCNDGDDCKDKNKVIDVTVAILAKDKAHTLPLFLTCLLNQTFPKNQIHLYIRSNDNVDNTIQLLKDFVREHGHKYKSVFTDYSNVCDKLKQYKQHEWNTERFRVLGDIRQKSVDWALKNESHYFVIDCDNFIRPDVLEEMYNHRYLNAVVAPMLCTTNTVYSNYHFEIDENGYYKHDELYFSVLNRKLKGLIEVPVVHCTYFIPYSCLPFVYYDDNSKRYEYVIFSDSCRKRYIPQMIDNRRVYGFITFQETKEEFIDEFTQFDVFRALYVENKFIH